jgi:hypothetical protein
VHVFLPHTLQPFWIERDGRFGVWDTMVERTPLASLCVQAKERSKVRCQIRGGWMGMFPACHHTACSPCRPKVEEERIPDCRAPFGEYKLAACLAQAHVQRSEESQIFKVAALQQEAEKKDAEILALKAVLRRRKAEIDMLQWEATIYMSAREELETRLELVRVACLGPVAVVMDAALEASRTRPPRIPLFGSPAIPMPDKLGRCGRSRSRSAAPPSPAYSPSPRSAAL